jgi:hypothetical protein
MNSVLVNRNLAAVDNVESFKCFLYCLYNKYNWVSDVTSMSRASYETHVPIYQLGRAIAEAVSRWLPTAAACVRPQV